MLRLKASTTLLATILLISGQPLYGSDALLSAAMSGDVAKLRSLLAEAGNNVNTARADGSTALAWAVYGNHSEAVKLLISAGADVNRANDYGVTPLALACANGNSQLVRRLLDAGADPERAKHNNETVLMTCSGVGALDAVRNLLALGVNVNAKETDEDQTALMWATAAGHAGVVRELLEYGADVHARSKVIPEPEPYLIEMPEDETVFGTNYPPTVHFPETSGGFTALHFAARKGDIDSTRYLLQAGADINSPHSEHGSPLVIAIASGHEDLAIFLLENGADPNIKDAWGIAPLHYALHEGVLILNNFKPSATDRFGWSRKNMPKLVRVLLDHGANPDARIEFSYAFLDNAFLGRAMDDPPQIDPVGATPLLLAAASGDLESMRYLAKVSDVNARTIGGATVFMLAAGSGAERGARHEEEALRAARFALEIGGGSVNDYLTEIAPDGPAEGMEDGRTTAHFVAPLGWMKMIRFLAEQGADFNVKDRYGMTPLQLALGDPEGRYNRQVGKHGDYDYRYRNPPAEGKGNKKMAELLVELGAEPFTGQYRDRSGE